MINSAKKRSLLLFLFTFISLNLYGQQDNLDFQQLPPIPDEEGFAGMYAGVSNGTLLAMGGANFPGAKPWQGGEKRWYDHIYYLTGEEGDWELAGEKLPNTLAYGVSVSYDGQVIVIGGSDAEKHYQNVFGVSFENGNITIDQDFSDLPVPMAQMAGTLVGQTIYIAGGISSPSGKPLSKFYALDLSGPRSDWQWVEKKSWPGPPRMQAVSAAHDGKFYLFSGINLEESNNAGMERQMLKDAFVFYPEKTDDKEQGWHKLPEMPRAAAAAANPAPVVGLSHILIPGGLDAQTAAHTDPATFPGFVHEVLAFHAQSNQWVSIDTLPSGFSTVTLPATQWNNQWVLVNGETKPGTRTNNVLSITNDKVAFGITNWIALFLYLSIMLYMGFYFSKRGKTTDDYFVAGRRIPWWAAGISIYGTQLSAITFIAIPAVVYATDWALAVGSLMILGIVPILVKFYLPFFRRLNVTSAYEYLEERFDIKVRLLGSITFMLMQLARIGIVVYLPSVAIYSVTGMDIYLCIAIMGVFSTIYTVLGGMEAVIWTDVIQFVVLIGGAFLCIVIATFNVDGGFLGILERGWELDKFRILRWGWDPSQLVFWVAFVGFFFLNLIPYTSDQTIVQRYLTVKDEQAAAKSLWTNGLVTIPGILIFFGLGTTLFIYYLDNPMAISSSKPDEVLPYYIVHNLPAGIAGIVIAGVFAASMSSLDSSMNSIATAFITDIQKRFNPDIPDRKNLRVAKWIVLVVGIIGTTSAMLIAAAEIKFIFDFFQEMLGMIGGGLAGIFILAIFTKRANATGVIIGILAGSSMAWYARNFTDIHVYLYGAVGVIGCVIVGYLASLVFPGSKKLKGTTFDTLVKEKDG